MLDLDSRYLAIIRKILGEKIPDQTVWVYGSRIKGASHEGSDLDLVILPSKTAITEKQFSELREALSESNLPILVDIVDWTTIPDIFRREIEKKHVILQQPKKKSD